jgi:hypothetical protein
MCDLMRFAVEFIDWSTSAADTSFEAEVDDVFSNKATSLEVVDTIARQLQIK